MSRNLSVITLLILCAAAIVAQQARGSLRGAVRDELGGLVAGATVTLTTANGEQKTATAGGSFGDLPSAHHPANAAAQPANQTAAPAPVAGASGHGPEAKRYALQLSVNFLNLFNYVNLGTPVGNLSSPFFAQSLNVNQYGGFGPSGSSVAGNRRIFAQLRLSF